MGNSVATVKQSVDGCSLSDLEVCERGIDIISTVDDKGQPDIETEVYGDESYICYYYCNNCTESWASSSYGDDHEQAWRDAKGHINV